MSIGVLTKRSQAKAGTGQNERAFSLQVQGAGRVKVFSLSGSYKRQLGASDVTFSCEEPLDGLEDARVSLRLGYGDRMVPFFDGTLQEPNTEDSDQRTAVAYGPFKLLNGQHLNEEVRYQAKTLEFCLLDLFRRANLPLGAVEIVRGRSYTVEEEVSTPETTIGEAISALIDAASFVAVDRPLFGRLVMPLPRPGATSRHKAVYGPSDYGPNAFKPRPSTTQRYARVTVFRRGPNGNNVVEATRPIENRGKYKPPRGRTYFIPEFPGTQSEAMQLAVDQAILLEDGLIPFTLEKIAINPDLALFDTVRVIADERRRGGRVRATYDCQIGEAIDFAISQDAHDETLSGSALEVLVEKLYDPIVLAGLSAGVIVTSPLERPKPSRVTASSNEYTVNDLIPYTVDEVSS